MAKQKIVDQDKEKSSSSIKVYYTQDNIPFTVKRIGNDFYAISNGVTLALGLDKKTVIKEAENYITQKIYKAPKYNIGLLNTLELVAMIDNKTLTKQEIVSYYEKNYLEDIIWLKEQSGKAIDRYCKAKYFGNNEPLNKSKYWKDFEKEAVYQLGFDDYQCLYKFIIQDYLDEIVKLTDEKTKKELDELE